MRAKEDQKRILPPCAVKGCPNQADPRWYAHDPDGALVMVCDGHSGLPCDGNPCTCPPTSAKRKCLSFSVGDRVVKNPETWTANEFDSWGRGVGVGVVVDPPFPLDENSVDVCPAEKVAMIEKVIADFEADRILLEPAFDAIRVIIKGLQTSR